jgi:dTDP-4-dehydrorhamnose 3,5-epimerase
LQLFVDKTELEGVKLNTTDRFEDSRGKLGGVYDEQLYFNAGLTAKFIYDMVSYSHNNVLRGIHGDSETTKLVQCLSGEVYSVILNCDKYSPDFGKWQGFYLSDENCHQLYIPPLFGCSYYVVSDDAVFHYKMSKAHSDNQFTYRWNDPFFNISWPTQNPILSERDANARLVQDA